jgi:NCAIR mutase (PurE)-related protein
MKNAKEILRGYKEGKISEDEAEKLIKGASILEVGDCIKLDVNRELRSGVPEIVFAQRKEPEETARCLIGIAEEKGKAIATKADRSVVDSIKKDNDFDLKYYEKSGIIVLKKKDLKEGKIGKIAVLSAGTSDSCVAEECCVIAEELRCGVISFTDVGIAGIHRLIEPLKKIVEEDVDCIIAIAGMEGALPSVIAGLVDVPVIGVPTSVGYGAGGSGKAALYSMLQSCSPGIAVVNIDNGFGAAVFASLIIRNKYKNQEKAKKGD